MVMGSFEWIALVVVVLSLIKIFVLLVNKGIWYRNVTKKVYGSNGVARLVFGVLALWLFYVLMQSLSIVEVFAVMAFASCMIAYAFSHYSKELLVFVESIVKKKWSVSMIVYILVWLGLCVWVLVELF
ncbi:MAG TPA: hypothetical protein VJK51_02155 [Candidatus Nanoarchaeia archaeon]|nr:hypothetical protein [Candidatus Nanoarchaeia archaeon]